MAESPTVILFSVDGMRPDAMAQASTPTIDRLIETGSHSLTARCVMPSVTLPCHTSMHRGVDVPRHGITTNTFQPLARPVPSLFDVASKHEKRTGFFINWPELRDLCLPDSLDVAVLLRDNGKPSDDWNVVNAALPYIEKAGFDLLFVYLGHTDSAGHQSGWMSAPYMAAIENADACIGRVLEVAEDSGRTVVSLVQSDHGGHEKSHGTMMDEDMLIPWVLSGPGVRQGHTLVGPVRIFDTCPTLATLLGLPMAKEWEGVPLEEALAIPVER